MPETTKPHSSANQFITPRGIDMPLVLATVRDSWSLLLEKEDIPMDTSFMDLGGDSLAVTQLFSTVWEKFGIELDIAEFFEDPTCSGISATVIEYLAELPVEEQVTVPEISSEKLEAAAKAIQKERNPNHKHDQIVEKFIHSQIMPLLDELDGAAGKCLVELQKGSQKPSLFLIHPVGGTVHCYKMLVDHLPDDISVYGLQSPLIHEPEPEFLFLEDMAEIYVKAIRTFQTEGPYRIAGWSGGGPYAFEIARQLTESGEKVSFLGLIDSPLQTEKFLSQASLLTRLNAVVKNGSVSGFSGLISNIREFSRFKLIKESKYRELREQHSLERISQMDKPMKGNLKNLSLKTELIALSIQLYCPRRYSGQITVFRTEEYKKAQNRLAPWDIQWARYAEQGVRFEELPGSHSSIMHQPHVEILADRILKNLE